MAYTLNTSHALYANLVELFGVQSGALVSHKTARTFTKHSEASYGTGTYGEHFTSVDGGYTVKGASFTPELVMNTSSNNKYSVFVVINARTTGGNAGLICKDGSSYSLCSPSFNGSNKAVVFQGYMLKFASSATVGTGAQTLCITHNESNGSTGNKLYLNGSLDSSGAPEYGNMNAGANYIGGYAGQGAVGASTVWIAIFDKELSAAEISDLHASLGANNAFGLVQSAASSTPTTISATLGAITGSVSSKSNPKTAISATLANVSSSITSGSGSLKTTITATLGNIVGAITSTGNTTNGTFTSEVLKDYAGNVLASVSLNYVRFYNDTTGTLVLNKTGVSTNASGIVTFSDAALVAGTTYRVDWETATGSRRMPRKAAS